MVRNDNITPDYFGVILAGTRLYQQPQESTLRAHRMRGYGFKPVDCFNPLLETVDRAYVSLHLKFQAYLSPIAGDSTVQSKAPPHEQCTPHPHG
jgi:hypothetical protein